MTRKVLLVEILLTAAACAATIVAYPHLPARVATHWDIHLRPNGYGRKWELFLLGPGLMAGVTLFTFLGPWLSPKRFQVDSFRSTWRQMMLLLFCMMGYIYAAILWAGLRHRIDAGRMILGGVCLIIVLMGNLMGKVRKNFYIGVRTPWTLASDRVWNATHRFAARTWMAGGILGLLFTIIGLRVLSISVLLVGGLAPYVYSLIIYKQLERSREM
jgi:uncharacterized membrane protein